jgi:type III secretion system needle length determinant
LPKASGPQTAQEAEAFRAPGQNRGEKDEPVVTESLSSLISAALDGHKEKSQAPTEVSGPTTPMDTAEVQDLAEKLVSRVLVADTTSQGQSVRLIVDPAILPVTEIHLDRGLDGFLNVTLVSNDANSLQTLIQARSDLEQALSRSEGAAFRLSLADEQSHEEAQGDSSKRRSAGLDLADSQE